MTSAVSLGLLVLLEAQTYHNFYRSATNCSRFLVVFLNNLRFFVHQRLLVPFVLLCSDCGCFLVLLVYFLSSCNSTPSGVRSYGTVNA